MSEFTYKPALTGNILSQYIQQRGALSIIGLFGKSQEELIAYQTAVLSNEIRNANASTQFMLGQVCNSIDSGFNMLSEHLQETNYKLGEINDTLNSMYSMLDWKTDIIIYLQRETNSLLKDLGRISAIPDRQKDSFAYLEKAITFFNAAMDEGFESELFEKVYSNLQSALKLDDDNFITNFYLGQLYLNSKKYLDPSKAEQAFSSSAKLAKILAISNAGNNQTTLFNQLQFGKTITNKEALNFEASSALIFASKAAYLQMNFQGAADYCKQAMVLTPNWTEPFYRYAKAMAANGDGIEAAIGIGKAIVLDRFQVIKILQDEDLNSKIEVQKFVTAITKIAIEELDTELKKCLTKDRRKTQANDLLKEASKLYISKTFLDAKKGLDILFEKREWSVTNLLNLQKEKDLDAGINYNIYSVSSNIIDYFDRYILVKKNEIFSSINILEYLNRFDESEIKNYNKIAFIVNDIEETLQRTGGFFSSKAKVKLSPEERKRVMILLNYVRGLV